MLAKDIWAAMSVLPLAAQLEAVSTCVRWSDSRCILAKYGKATVEQNQFPLRQVRVYRGKFRYSEVLEDGKWHRLAHPISQKQLAAIDEFDAFGKRFKLNRQCQLGDAEDLGLCPEKHYTPEQNTAVGRKHAEKAKRDPKTVKRHRALQSFTAS